MNPAQLLEHFDRISDAPDAVARLRRFILDLAVRGKLVEQDPNNEPAVELLKRIQSEKARCEKKSKELAPVTVDEAPFDVPAGWEWVRIRQITADRGQTVPKGDFTYIDVTAIDKERGCIGEPTILSSTDAPSRARKVVKKGDVIYSCVRPYLLNIAIVDTEISPPPIASTAFAVMDGFGLTLPQYLWTALRSPFMVESVEERMRGQAYPAINDSDFSLLPIPLPPLAEQHRIVAKVDELMVLCDQLEAAKNKREARRDRLVAASLHRIGTAPAATDEAATDTQSATSLRAATRFHLDHLPRLTTRPEHIKRLRQSILNLAVHGHLVPQDPNDEPAAESLGRMLASRRATWEQEQLAKLAANGKRQSNHLLKNYIAPDHEDGLFRIPDAWVWASTLEVCMCVENGNTPAAAEMTECHGDIPFIKVYNLTKTGALDFSVKPTFISRQVHEKRLSRSRILPGDVLMNIVGPPLGKVSVVPDKFPEWNTNQAVVLFRPASVLLPKYLAVCLLSNDVLIWITRLAQATVGQSNISVSKSRLLPIPLPPLAEQHRIVAKVDELMALCDQLEAQLTATQINSRRLLEAVLHEALAAAA